MKLFLVRHGETEFNKKCNGGGQPDETHLNELGLFQAKELSYRLKDVCFDKIFSSPLTRAKQTSLEINQFQRTKLIFDDRLKEYDRGEVDPSSEEWKKKYEELLALGVSKYEIRPYGKENIWDFIKRLKSFLKEIQNEKGTFLVVAHAGVNSAILNLSQNKKKSEFLDFSQDNACINLLEFKNKKWKINLVNDSEHTDYIPKFKKKYANQIEIKKEIQAEVLNEFGRFFEELYFSKNFYESHLGCYNRTYKRNKGSLIELYGVLNKNFKMPKTWKIYFFNQDKIIYEIGKIIISGIKHRIYFVLFKSKKHTKN